MPDRQLLLRARVDEALEEFLAEEAGQVTALHDGLGPVVDQLRITVAGGKRMRAAFCYWGWRAAGQPDTDAMIRAAAAVELAHAAAIVHDDIIDSSPVRRGMPSAHIALRKAAGNDGGTALAILVGDMLMVWAAHLFSSCGLPQTYLGRARRLWITFARELVAGECLEILSGAGTARVHRAMEIIRLKTAKYTVERPLHIGGTLGGASPQLLAAFTEYGLPLGEAFQLRDDLLGVFGDPDRTGKSNLDDLRAGKPTVLLALTLSGANPAEREELDRLLDKPGLDTSGLRIIQEIMQRVGAREQVEAMIGERAAAARTALERIRMPSDVAEALTQLVSATVARRS
jgi:geranylgeranyl diphosphate synthase type I